MEKLAAIESRGVEVPDVIREHWLRTLRDGAIHEVLPVPRVMKRRSPRARGHAALAGGWRSRGCGSRRERAAWTVEQPPRMTPGGCSLCREM